jgi:phosphate transport system substrate-binding protein
LILVSTLALPASSGAGPQLTVSQTDDLINEQYVRVAWSGLTPAGPGEFKAVYLRQCKLTPKDFKDCGDLVVAGEVAPSGAGAYFFPIVAGTVNLPVGGNVPVGRRFPCDFKHRCSIMLFLDDDGEDVSSAIKVPISFAITPEFCPEAQGAPVQGAGTAAIFRAMLKWEGEVCLDPHRLNVLYNLGNSPSGIESFLKGSVDFAITTKAPTAKQLEEIDENGWEVGYAPLAISGLVFGFRLFDAESLEQITEFRLTPALLAQLFTAQLINFRTSPEVSALNPGWTFPQTATAWARADQSAQTWAVINWFQSVARPSWDAGGEIFQNADPETMIYPPLPAVNTVLGADKVAKEIARPSGAGLGAIQFYTHFAYMDSSYAALYGLPTAAIENEGGQWVKAADASLLAALEHATVNPDGVTRVPDWDTDDPAAYPLVNVSYLLVRTDEEFDGSKGAVLQDFIRYAVSDEGQDALPAGYTPLTSELRTAAEDVSEKINTKGSENDPPPPGDPPSFPPAGGGPTDPSLAGLDPQTAETSDAEGDEGGLPEAEEPAFVAAPPAVPAGNLATSASRMVLPALMGLGALALLAGPAVAYGPKLRQSRAAARAARGKAPRQGLLRRRG